MQNNIKNYIISLIKANKLYKFYHSTAWESLRDEVLKEQHYECQLCKARGIYTRADTVHHINYVRIAPHLALSRYDEQGRQNLIAVCATCHNEIHKTKHKGFTNEERW